MEVEGACLEEGEVTRSRMGTREETEAGMTEEMRTTGTRRGTEGLGLGIELESKDLHLGTKLGTEEGLALGTELGTEGGLNLGTELGTEKGLNLGTELGTEGGLDLGTELDTEEGLDLGTELETEDGLGPDLATGSHTITDITRTGPGLETDTVRDSKKEFLYYTCENSFHNFLFVLLHVLVMNITRNVFKSAIWNMVWKDKLVWVHIVQITIEFLRIAGKVVFIMCSKTGTLAAGDRFQFYSVIC